MSMMRRRGRGAIHLERLLHVYSASTVLALFAGQLAAQPLASAEALPMGKSDLPVSKVVLYSSGVGYFEHAGSVTGDSRTELSFRTGQINDLLKSLVLEDLGGGTVGSIVYPSQDPIDKTLRSFQVDLTNDPSLAKLLAQLRGAEVILTKTFEQAPIRGTILGVETKTKVDKDGVKIESAYLNLAVNGTLSSLSLDQIEKVELVDPQLQAELTKALAALAQARNQDKKPIAIELKGKGERKVRLAYVVETPIWKTSYRLVLRPEGPARMQGWAIVENQTDADWNGIDLSLVSGRPISFIQDLYQPLYLKRPVVVPELHASLRPSTYEEGILLGKSADMPMPAQAAAPPASVAMRRGQRGMLLGREAASPAEEMAPEAPFDPTASIASAADAQKLGELFSYNVDNVSLPRQRSAMIPIVTDPIQCERLSIYNQQSLARHPLRGARITNSTGKHLLDGPITVFDDSAYAGDAQISNLPPGQIRLLSYAIDLDVVVNADPATQTNVLQTGKIAKGVLILSRKLGSTHKYAFQNKSDRDKKIVLEHPITHGWSLVDTLAPVETTDQLYRFELAAAAGKPADFVVRQEVVTDERIALVSSAASDLLVFSRNRAIPPKVREALTEVIRMKGEMEETQRMKADAEAQVAAIGKDQTRLRENIKTVNSGTQLHTRYLAKLQEQEDQIDRLQTEIDRLQKQFADQTKALANHLAGLTID